MKMTRFAVAPIAAAALAFSAVMPTPSFAAADVVAGDLIKIFDGTGDSPGGGFDIDVLTNGAGIDFISFCLETDEFISPGTTYKVGAVSDKAVNGGSGGPSPDPISFATAWLYSNFRAGSLAGYDGTAPAATDLQKAIWYLEDEGVAYGSLSAQAQGWVVDAMHYGTSLGKVRVINLVDRYTGAAKQDQLTLVPEPETYAMLLAGLGLMGFVARRRKPKAV